jgi:cobalt-precorrin 5A hydrolase
MGVDQAMIVAGIGCRKGAAAAEIEAAVATALVRAGLSASALSLIATSAAKGGEGGIAAAASALGVPLVLVPQRELEAAGPRTMTTSARVIAATGVPSLAEAAALAAGGPAAQLIAPRVAVGGATCALARSGDAAGDAARDVQRDGP